MKQVFTATLIIPQGLLCQFKVFCTGVKRWEFVNENLGMIVYLNFVPEIGFSGSLLYQWSNEVQQNIVVCQAIFELQQYFKTRY